MNTALLVVVVVAVATGAGPSAPLSFGRFGDVRLLGNQRAPKSVALLLSTEAGWGAREGDLARALAKRDALVVGVDSRRYMSSFAGRGRCMYLAGDLELLSQYVQKRLGLSTYTRPIVVGAEDGGTLAYAAFVQGPPGTFRGAASIGGCEALRTRAPLCRSRGLKGARHAEGVAHVPVSPSGVDGWMLVAHDWADCERPVPRELSESLGSTTHPRFPSRFARAYASLASVERPPPFEGLRSLPLIAMEASTAREGPFAVMLSGEGGFGGIDENLARYLAGRGIPVAGLSSLDYLWRRRTAQQVALHLALIIERAGRRWRKERVLLVGYSRGAQALSSAAGLLPPKIRARISGVVLLAPARTAELEVTVGHLFSRAGAPMAPLVEALAPLPTWCVYGTRERGLTVCTQLSSPPTTRVVRLNGGHDFGGNYAALRRVMSAVLAEVSGQ